MTTVYAGILFLEEKTSDALRLALFLTILTTNLYFFALWLCIGFELLKSKNRLAAKLFDCMKRLIRYREVQILSQPPPKPRRSALRQEKEETDSRLLRPHIRSIDEVKKGQDEQLEGRNSIFEKQGNSFREEEPSKRGLVEELKSSKTSQLRLFEPPVCAYSARRKFKRRKASAPKD